MGKEREMAFLLWLLEDYVVWSKIEIEGIDKDVFYNIITYKCTAIIV